MDDVEEDKPQARAPGEPTDVDLVRADREGDVHAFEELHRRYVASIYRLVRRKLGDALLAEDIAQETFMKALRMMDRVDESFNFGGWIHTVARNLCYDALRRRQRDLRADRTDEADAESLANLPSTTHSVDHVDVDDATVTRWRAGPGAERLPEKYGHVLSLRALEE